MLRAWLCYTLILVCAVTIWIYVPALEADILLASIVILPLLCAAFHRLTKSKIRVKFSIRHASNNVSSNVFDEAAYRRATSVEKNASADYIVRSEVRGRFLMGQAKGHLICENRLTGTAAELPLRFRLSCFSASETYINAESEFCGKLAFSFDKLRIYDMFGLTYITKRVNIPSAISVYPDIRPFDISLGAPTASPTADTEYYLSRQGFDISEPLGIREYREGDSPRSIHWKLSAKLGRMAVREPSLPSEHSLLLLFETGYPSGQIPMPLHISMSAEMLVSASQQLLVAGFMHHVAWHNKSTGLINSYRLDTEDDLAGIIPKLLEAGQAEDGDDCLSHYIRSHGEPDGFRTAVFAADTFFDAQYEKYKTEVTLFSPSNDADSQTEIAV